MARSSVAVFGGDFRHVKGLEAVQRRLGALPAEIKAPLKGAAEKSIDEFVHRFQEIAPIAPEFERHPGELRASAHREAGATEIAAKAVVDARDQDGNFYPAHVEYGHRTKGGAHVAAKPAFWPLWQVSKRKVKARMSRAIKGAASLA